MAGRQHLRHVLVGAEREVGNARHADDRDVPAAHARLRERRKRSCLQPVGGEVVVARHDEGKAEAGARLRAFDNPHV